MFRTAPLAMRSTRALRMQATPRRMMPTPKDEHSAHTISQRLRRLREIPVELLPLGAVLLAAIAAAGFTVGRTFYKDRTLRLSRSGELLKAESRDGNEH